MKKKDAEKRLRSAFEAVTPAYSANIPSQSKIEKGSVITMTEIRKKNNLLKKIAAVAAALVLVVGCAWGAQTYIGSQSVATIQLDVNPSIAIEINRNQKVVEVTPLNEEGKIVVGDMDFEGDSIDQTVNALVGSMLLNGYIDSANNSILLSVDDTDASRASQLQQRLSGEIEKKLSANIKGSVISQTVHHDDDLDRLAEEYGITVGKAQLIRDIMKDNTSYKFEDLAKLTINQLNLISRSGNKELTSAEAVGSASQAAYIGDERAEEIARGDVTAKGYEAVAVERPEMDYEYGRMIYELEVRVAGGEYEYDIDAATGEILSCRFDKDDEDDKYEQNDQDDQKAPSKDQGERIGSEKALSIAYAHAGVSAQKAKDVECEYDYENGKYLYEVSFECDGYEYEYDIEATSGKILKNHREKED